MIKSELVQMIADKNPHLYHRDIERIVNTVLDEIISAMKIGDGWSCAVLAPFRSSPATPAWAAIRARHAVEVVAKRVPFSRPARNCASA